MEEQDLRLAWEAAVAEMVARGAAMRSLLDLVSVERRSCRYCDADIALVRHRAGGVGPYDYPAGTSHFATCPHAARVRAEVAARRAQPERERAAAAAAGAAIAATAGGGLVQLPPEPQQQTMFATPVRGAMR